MNSETRSYPMRDECLNILRDSGCPEKVIQHILVVTEIALKIAKYFPKANLELLEAGALLHDIGRSKTHDVNHAVEGSRLARELMLPEELISIIERHITAGIKEDDAIELGLPAKDYTPITIEEKIVAHADNLVEHNKRCTISRSVEILTQKGLPEVAERVRQLHIELSNEAGINIDEIK